LTFTNQSIVSDCNDVLVSEVSRQQFKGKETQTLSSNFVNFNSFVFYAVKNGNGAVVGVVVGDGIVVNFGTQEIVQSVEICLQISGTLSSDYPVLDFAYRYVSLCWFTSFCLFCNVVRPCSHSLFFPSSLDFFFVSSSNEDFTELTPLGLSVSNENGIFCSTVEQVSGN
jgi:hypothetical protein